MFYGTLARFYTGIHRGGQTSNGQRVHVGILAVGAKHPLQRCASGPTGGWGCFDLTDLN